MVAPADAEQPYARKDTANASSKKILTGFFIIALRFRLIEHALMSLVL
jgi:hypothetical protein